MNDSLTDDRARRGAIMVICVVWLVIAGALFAGRGVYRGVTGFDHDLMFIYAAAGAWLNGDDAYDVEALRQALRRGGLDVADDHWQGMPASLYPPGSMAVMSPIALLSWDAARWTWRLINITAWLAVIVLTIRKAGLPRSHPGAIALAGLLLAMAPVHTGLAFGQLAIVTTALLLGAYAIDPGKRPVLAGLCLGLAAAMKPQLAVAFILLELFAGRWRSGATAFALAGACMAGGITRLTLAGHDWLAGLKENLAMFPDSWGDATLAGDEWYQMIDLGPLLHLAIDSPSVVRAVTLASMTAIGLVAMAVYWRRRSALAETLLLAVAAAGSLLVTYHRVYDATLVVFIAVAGVRLLRHGQRLAGLAITAMCVAFLSPGGALVVRLASADAARANLATQLGTLHLTLVLLALIAALIAAMFALRSDPPTPAGPARPAGSRGS